MAAFKLARQKNPNITHFNLKAAASIQILSIYPPKAAAFIPPE